ncbi:hypothetical protein ABTK84_19975, partial [Acinetobacter baumannii]
MASTVETLPGRIAGTGALIAVSSHGSAHHRERHSPACGLCDAPVAIPVGGRIEPRNANGRSMSVPGDDR